MNKINKLKYLSLLLGIVLVLTALPLATAASTDRGSINIQGIVNSSTYGGTAWVLNVTNVSLFDQMVNCTFYVKSSATANSSWSTLGTASNATYGSGTFLRHVNKTYDTTRGSIEDSNVYYLNATCRNLTAAGYNLAVAMRYPVIISNTIPQAASSPGPTDDDKDTDGDVTFIGTVVGSNTTACTLYFANGSTPGSASYTMTHAGNNCSYRLSDMPEQTYNWYILATDGSNTTASSTWNVEIDKATGHRAGLILKDQPSKVGPGFALSIGGVDSVAGVSLNMILIIGIAGIVIFFVVRTIKKR